MPTDIPAPIGLGKNLKQRHLNINPFLAVHSIEQCSEQLGSIIEIGRFDAFAEV
jgi:hypothetical protein